MNKLIIACLVVAVSACSVSREESYKRKSISVMQQVELAGMQKHGFCEGDKLKSYIETKYYFQFTCFDGRNFMMPKERS